MSRRFFEILSIVTLSSLPVSLTGQTLMTPLGFVEAIAGPGGTTIRVPGSSSFEITLSCDAVYDAIAVDDLHAVVLGRSSVAGGTRAHVYLLLADETVGFALLDELVLPGRALKSAARTPTFLALLDEDRNEVIAAPWPGHATLPSAAAFALVADTGTAPVLAHASKAAFSFYGAGGAVVFRDPEDPPTWYGLTFEGGSFRLSASTASLLESGVPRWRVRNARSVPSRRGFTLLAVGATAPTPYEIRFEPTGDLLWTGLHPGDDEELFVAAESLWHQLPGWPFQVTGGELAPDVFWPQARYGEPTVSSAVRLRDIVVPAAWAFDGSARFATRYALALAAQPPAGSIDVTGYLLVAARQPSGDPVSNRSGVWLLDEQAVIPFELTLDGVDPDARGRIPFPLPADGSLNGTVLLFQFMFELPAETVVTSVRGTMVLPASESPLARLANSTGGAAALSSTEADGVVISSPLSACRLAAQACTPTSVQHVSTWLSQRDALTGGARGAFEAAKARIGP